MASLTHIAATSRKAITYSAIGLIAYIFLKYTLIIGIAIYRQLKPPPPPKPTVGFGLLPPVSFPSAPQYSFQFQLQTPDGKFPVIPESVNVYPMKYKTKANLFDFEQAKLMASKLRFPSNYKQIDDRTLEWRKAIPAPMIFIKNVVTDSFKLEYKWQADPDILSNKVLLSDDQAFQAATGFFQSIERLPLDITMTNGVVTYYRATANQMVPAMSLSESDFIRLDYYRNEVIPTGATTGYRVVTPKPKEGIINLILSRSPLPDRQIISVNYSYGEVLYESPETYPLTPVALAWEKLKNGQAYIASNNSNSTMITIRRIYLAYYDSPTAQEFLQPIYIFAGDEDFIAYVPAVDDSMIEKGSTQ